MDHVDVEFGEPPLGRRGYHRGEVDAFLEIVTAALKDSTGHTLTPEQVRNAAFAKAPIGRRGYSITEVDRYLDEVERELKSRRDAMPAPPLAPKLSLPAGRASSRHGSAKHAASDTVTRRVLNVVIGISARIAGGLSS